MLLERRLRHIGRQLTRLRAEVSVADEQLAHFTDDADDARIRSLVSETPVADVEHRHAERHAAAMSRHRQELTEQIGRLEQEQDDLLDRLAAKRSAK